MHRIWNAVSVLVLTYENAVLCVGAQVQGGLQAECRDVGRLAAGAHGKTLNDRGTKRGASFQAKKAE